MPRAVMPKKPKLSQFNPHAVVFRNFSLSQCFKGCFSCYFPPQRAAGTGWMTFRAPQAPREPQLNPWP